MRKSQVTIFIILGIVSIIIFGILFSIYQGKAKEGNNANIGRVTSSQIDFTSVRSYITMCLEDSSKEAIERLGYQGGYLYDYQVKQGMQFQDDLAIEYYSDRKGRYYNITIAQWDEENMDYSDTVRKGGLAYPPKIGTYPYGLNRIGKQPTWANFPKLCETNGTHGMTALNSSCETFDPEYSIQAVLQRYIRNKTLKCLNFSTYEEEKGYEVKLEKSNVSAIMGESNVLVKMKMPVTIKVIDPEGDLDEQIETSMQNFVVDLPVRLRDIHELAWHLLKRDASDIFFNLAKITNASLLDCRIYNGTSNRRNETGPCVKPGIKIQYRKEGLDRYGFVYIEDSRSRLTSNEPYQFVIAIDNRKPHLDKVSYHGYSEAYKRFLKSWYDRSPEELYSHATRYPLDPSYDIIVDAGEELIIVPYAIDPDEDSDPSNRTVMDKTYIYQSTTISDLLKPYHFPNTPYDWFGKDVRNRTNISDVGTHLIKLTVRDNLGKTNTKTIKVQIRCTDLHTEDLNLPYSLDSDEYNDCCDEAGGYKLITTISHSCGLCKRCTSSGECKFIEGNPTIDLEECGPCRFCNKTLGGCDIDDARDAACPPGDKCCEGACTTPIDITDPLLDWSSCVPAAYNYNQLIASDPKHADCWTPNKVCIPKSTTSLDKVSARHSCLRGLITNRPVSGPRAQGINCSVCDKGSCISS